MNHTHNGRGLPRPNTDPAGPEKEENMEKAKEMLSELIEKLWMKRWKLLKEAERAKGWVKHYGSTYTLAKVDMREAAKWLRICEESFDEAEALLERINELDKIKKAMEVEG